MLSDARGLPLTASGALLDVRTRGTKKGPRGWCARPPPNRTRARKPASEPVVASYPTCPGKRKLPSRPPRPLGSPSFTLNSIETTKENNRNFVACFAKRTSRAPKTALKEANILRMCETQRGRVRPCYASDVADPDSTDFYSPEETAKVLGVSLRRVQQLAGEGSIEGERHGRSWRLARWSVHRYLEERGPGRPRVSRLDRERAAGSPESAREWVDRMSTLQRELGRLEGRLEITEKAESTVREERDRLLEERARERERVERLEEELREHRRLLAGLIERMPELEAPHEQPEAPERVEEEPERAEPRSGTGGPQESAERPPDTAEWPVRGALLRPWWRRVFGG